MTCKQCCYTIYIILNYSKIKFRLDGKNSRTLVVIFLGWVLSLLRWLCEALLVCVCVWATSAFESYRNRSLSGRKLRQNPECHSLSIFRRSWPTALQISPSSLWPTPQTRGPECTDLLLNLNLFLFKCFNCLKFLYSCIWPSSASGQTTFQQPVLAGLPCIAMAGLSLHLVVVSKYWQPQNSQTPTGLP